jgi:hypothetical protein
MCAPLGSDTRVRPYISSRSQAPAWERLGWAKLCLGTARIGIKDNGGPGPPPISSRETKLCTFVISENR